jgi:hypothetical protein
MFGLIGITAGRALPPKSSETARPVDALFSSRQWVVAIGRLVRHVERRTPRDVPSLTNLRWRIAEVGGALGPPIVKGGTPRGARGETRTLKREDPCDQLIGVTASSSPTRPGCLRHSCHA